LVILIYGSDRAPKSEWTWIFEVVQNGDASRAEKALTTLFRFINGLHPFDVAHKTTWTRITGYDTRAANGIREGTLRTLGTLSTVLLFGSVSTSATCHRFDEFVLRKVFTFSAFFALFLTSQIIEVTNWARDWLDSSLVACVVALFDCDNLVECWVTIGSWLTNGRSLWASSTFKANCSWNTI